VAALRGAVELSEGRSWEALAALAEVYGKAGRFTEAVQAARQALDLALQEHDAQLESSLREALGRYEREAAETRP
jgi:Flp pilus assembly protein TadD